MRALVNTCKIFPVLSLLVFTFFSSHLNAQSLSFSVTPGGQCFVSGGTNTAVVNVSSAPSGATSYTWSITGPCGSAGVTTVSSSGSLISISYSCCGTYSFNCTALNSSFSSVGTVSSTLFIACPPTIAALGNTLICAGGSSTLSAFGANSYTWNAGSNSSQVVVSPSATTNYQVSGSNSFGCIGTNTITVAVAPSVVANFTYTQGSNGQVSFVNLTTNTTVSTTYTWNFGNGATSNNISPAITYTSNGAYAVILTANSGCGNSLATHTVNVSSSCHANFTYTPLSGTYIYSSTSTGVSGSTNYTWKFGNGSATYSATGSAGINPPAQTYTSGPHTVVLFISTTNPACSDSVVSIINVCALSTHFTKTELAGNSVVFASTSTGTLSTSTYSWNYGDGASGMGVTSQHTYSSTGTYTPALFVNNSSNCGGVLYSPFVITGCTLGSSFSHTTHTNGFVNFSSLATNATSNTIYYWNFGDGVFSYVNNPSHTYSNAGTYNVSLKLADTLTNCKDSLTQSVNVTGIPCTANSGFTVTQTSNPEYWMATLIYPWNISSAIWYWGDGTHSNGLYSSHIYSVTGTYSICLSVTVSCGAASLYCFPYTLSNSGGSSSPFIYINVVAPGMNTGIYEAIGKELNYTIYPNPTTGEFTIDFESWNKNVSVIVHDLFGKIIYEDKNVNTVSDQQRINLDNAANGIYFIEVLSGDKKSVQKIIVNR